MSFLTRAFVRFEKNPSSVRYAAAAIISTIVVLVIAGALLMRVFDPDEYPTFGSALWFTLQTVTTVGYGDSTPTSGIGRVVASIVMLVAIGLITVITAGITSLLIRSISREQEVADRQMFSETLARIEATLTANQERLDQLTEAAKADRTDGHDPRH